MLSINACLLIFIYDRAPSLGPDPASHLGRKSSKSLDCHLYVVDSGHTGTKTNHHFWFAGWRGNERERERKIEEEHDL